MRRVVAGAAAAALRGARRGGGRWLEVDAYPSDGGVSVLMRDITARKLDESRLAEQFTRLEAMYTTADAVSRARALDTI